ncbi:MAG: LytTR family DNA-binding domain-containing protein, partial [Pseudomonadota bacterium]
LHAEHKYVTVIYRGGEVLIEEPLKALEDEFGDRFMRVHRNALVALTAVAGLEKSEGQIVVRLHGTERRLEVSRRNLPQVRKIIKGL